jgi:RNA polymerase sigma factor (sigma-70 family)
MDASPAQVITAASTALATTAAPNAVAELTTRLRAGDEAAWREFHDTYCHRLLRYLLVVTRGEEDLAHNALQGAFLRAVRHARRFDSEAALWSWLTVLAVSAVRDERRKHQRYRSFLGRWFTWLSVSPPDPAPVARDQELHSLLADALAALPAGDAGLVQSKYFEDQSVRDIAAALGTTEKAVESRLTRIRARLRHDLLSRLRHESESGS